MRSPLVSLTIVALAAAACTTGGFGSNASPAPTGTPVVTSSPSAPSTIDHPTGPNDLVLRIAFEGGFIGPNVLLSRLPIVSVLGDGRIITEGPAIQVYPGPALPNLLVSRVSEQGLQRILEAAQAAGLLGPDHQYDFPGIADAPTTTFTAVSGGQTHTVTAYALGEATDATGIPPAEAAGRKALADFQAKMTNLSGWLGTDITGAEQPYAFESIRIFSSPGDPTSSADQSLATVADWPLAAPLATFGGPYTGYGRADARCGVVTGDDLATLLPAIEKANQLTFWKSAGKTYSLLFRPLLPDESGCPQG